MQQQLRHRPHAIVPEQIRHTTNRYVTGLCHRPLTANHRLAALAAWSSAHQRRAQRGRHAAQPVRLLEAARHQLQHHSYQVHPSGHACMHVHVLYTCTHICMGVLLVRLGASYRVMACTVVACIVIVRAGMPYIDMARKVMAHTVMAYIGMACTVMA